MERYQELIGKIILSISIIIASILIARSIDNGVNALSSISSSLNSLGTAIRDGMLQLGSAS